MASKVKSDDILGLIILFGLIIALAYFVRYVQQSGGYSVMFGTDGFCGLEQSMEISKKKEELERTLWPYEPK